jgi:hypothetical protein
MKVAKSFGLLMTLGVFLAFSSIYVSAHGLSLLLPWFRQAPALAWMVVGVLSSLIILVPAGFLFFKQRAFWQGLIVGLIAVAALGLYSMLNAAPVGRLFFHEYAAMVIGAGGAAWLGFRIRKLR